MPSLQTVNFGPNPLNETMRNLASGFMDQYNINEEKKRNDHIFRTITSKYPTDAKPEDIFKDLLSAEGMDESYKKNKISEIKDFVTLKSKGNYTPYQKAMLDLKEEEMGIKKKKTERDVLKEKIQAKNKDATAIANTKKQIMNFTEKTAKRENLDGYQLADLNRFVSNAENLARQTNQDFDLESTIVDGLDYVKEKATTIATTQVTTKPSSMFGVGDQKMAEAEGKLYDELSKLYDQGITNQKDLRTVAKRGNWLIEDINRVVSKLLQDKGKAPKKKDQRPDLDSLLFGG
jgi:hypothetical protein